jgi:glycosyltransferase involved in cell wall biosynthesis
LARVAMVQSYPYEAVSNGDAAYIAALRDYLIGRGHEVFGFVTDMTRGRTSPIYRSAYDLSATADWKVRQAIRARRTFVSGSVAQWAEPFRKKLGLQKAEPRRDEWTASEAKWLAGELKRLEPSCAILFFDAAGFGASIDQLTKVVAAPSFLRDREISILPEENTHPLGDDEVAAQLSWLRGAHCVAFNSQDDIDFARRYGFEKAIKINMGLPDRSRDAPHLDNSEPTITFVGVAARQNIESCQWFLDRCWPIIRKARPDVRLRLVGTVVRGVDVAGLPGVDAVGFVPDLEPEYRRAHVVVAPLVSGSRGVKVKVAEALSYGCPLVTTSIGVDAGDPNQFGEAVVVADEPGAFATAVLDLLNDPLLRRKRQALAAEAFNQNFSFDAAFGELTEYLNL